MRPTYLPWLERGEEPPEPDFTYDDGIDRAQESWANPHVAPGKGGVGLTRYSLPGEAGSSEEEVGQGIHGVPGYVHVGEGGSVSASWDLPNRCNLIELIVVDPRLTVREEIHELKRIAQSFESR